MKQVICTLAIAFTLGLGTAYAEDAPARKAPSPAQQAQQEK